MVRKVKSYFTIITLQMLTPVTSIMMLLVQYFINVILLLCQILFSPSDFIGLLIYFLVYTFLSLLLPFMFWF